MRGHRSSRRQEEAGDPPEINVEALAVVVVIVGDHAIRGLFQVIGRPQPSNYVIQLGLSWFDKRNILRLERMVKCDAGPIYWATADKCQHQKQPRYAHMTRREHLVTLGVPEWPELEFKIVRTIPV